MIMDMHEVRERLDKIANLAARNSPGRAAQHVEGHCVRLANLSVTADCIELAEAIRELRASEGFPGSLAAWTWFDDKLFVLANELDCTPAVGRSTIADRARIREGV
jgi:hypothetical protein